MGELLSHRRWHFLLDLPNSEVRVPDAQSLIENRLRPLRRFHPKTLLLEQGRDVLARGPTRWFANMTLHGLSLRTRARDVAQFKRDQSVPGGSTAVVACLHDTFENSTEIGHEFRR